MSNPRYSDNRYPRDRSPARYGDRRPSGAYGGGFDPSRDPPRGPKSLLDGPRGPSGAPSGPRDSRRGGYAGRGEVRELRNAPPLSEPRDRWRGADRDREFDRRDRRASPRGRSPIRDSRDSRDYPRELDLSRARRNSRDGPLSAGSNFSDHPPASAQSYRGGGFGRGRGRDSWGDFRGRGRGHNHFDDRDRREPYRPRSRSREPLRRDIIRDERDLDRRDDRRFDRRDDERRVYDSYKGQASNLGSGPRNLDTRHSTTGATSGPSTPHPFSATSAHSAGDRLGFSEFARDDAFSRRSSVATDPYSAKERRESDKNELLAGRAEASRDRYGSRASSPPPQAPQVPAFGSLAKPAQFPATVSNVWRNPNLDAKPLQQSPAAKPTPAPLSATSSPAPAAAPKPQPSIPAGLAAAPPTGPKATRIHDRPPGEEPAQEPKPSIVEPSRNEAHIMRPSAPAPLAPAPSDASDVKPSNAPPVPSPPLGLAPKPRGPPTGPQSTSRVNVSPSQTFGRLPVSTFPSRDASPGATPFGPRFPATSPKSVTGSIPTGPKADRNLSGSRSSLGYGKPNQWIRPGVPPYNRPIVPSKRDFPNDDKDRVLENAPKAPRLDTKASSAEFRTEAPKTEVPVGDQPKAGTELQPDRASPSLPTEPSPKVPRLDIRRNSDVSMTEAFPQLENGPKSASSAAPDVIEEDSDDDLELDEAYFAESEEKFKKQKAALESELVDLSAPNLRAITPLQELMLLANITPDHLLVPEMSVVEERVSSPDSVQHPSKNIAPDFLTPKAEEQEDVVMEEASPATSPQQVRAKREASLDQDFTPDASNLPYLGDGPPTPLSDPDQDRAPPPETILLAIRDTLRKDLPRETDIEDTLRQYAAAYKDWRTRVQQLDEEKEHDELENRQQSAEPGPKPTTPDVASAVTMGPILEQPTGRRAHAARWATEYDYERVLKESMRTAEEEKGKKDKDPKATSADPEREASIPDELSEYEVKRREFVNTNFEREPGQALFVYHYEPPEDDFTEAEHQIMVKHYKAEYSKKWGKLAEMLYKEAGTHRTYKDCINHYYATKWGKEYKGKVKRGKGTRKTRGGGAGRARASANTERPELYGDDGMTSLATTDRGRPRRAAAPTFGAESELEAATPAPTPARLRSRQDNTDGAEKTVRRGRVAKEKTGGRRPKNQPLAAAPAGSPVKIDRNEKMPGVKMEDIFSKRPMTAMEEPQLLSSTMPPQVLDETMAYQDDGLSQQGLNAAILDRPKTQQSQRAGPSSYWSVMEQNDFKRNVAHFGTDFAAIANHMGTKTQTMVKNQYQRLLENGADDLAQAAAKADGRRQAGDDLGRPPTPTLLTKRRFEIPVPRTIAPNPDMMELANTPATQPFMPPHSSPQFTASRLQAIAQASTVPQKPVLAPQAAAAPAPEATRPSGPSISRPPAAQPQAQQSRVSQHHHSHHHSHSQHKANLPGPRAGFFSDDLPRGENRPTSQSANISQLARAIQHQGHPVQSSAHVQQQLSEPSFRQSLQQQERELQARLDHSRDHESQARYQQHVRRPSQELLQRQYQANPPGAPHTTPQMRVGLPSAAGSPESRPIQQPVMQPPQPIPVTQHFVEGPAPGSNSNLAAMHHPRGLSQQSVHTPPVKEEPRQYPSAAQPPVPPATATPTPTPAAASKPAEPPRKSNLMSLLNDAEPEEPRRKRPSEHTVPSHTSTPQQQRPIAPPPPVSQPLSRRDVFTEIPPTQPTYSRSAYNQQLPQTQAGPARQVVDLTHDQPTTNSRTQFRDSWRQSFQPQIQAGSHVSSPHPAVAQPNIPESRIFGNHRSVFAQHNAPRHNPSPPPHPGYAHSPHIHSRTPSLSHPPQQTRQTVTPGATPHAQSGAQILQPNPYAQVDPQGAGPQSSAAVGMRPSPHLRANSVVQQREISGRSMNEQAQSHNANVVYSNPQTPGESHPPHHHPRGSSIAEHLRTSSRDLEFDARNRERDVGKEISQRVDMLVRERESMMPGMQMRGAPTPPHQQAQDHRYTSFPPPGRSNTPLSRVEHPHPQSHQHVQHPGAQHQRSMPEANYLYRPQEEQHRLREAYPSHGSRDGLFADRIREEQVQQQARMRNEWMRDNRESNDRFNQLIDRGPTPSQAQAPRPPPGPPDWTAGVNRFRREGYND